MNDKIEIGDVVKFTFDNSPPITGIVKGKPQDTGDCWRVYQEATNWTEEKVYYIQTFSFIERLSSETH